MKTGYHNSYLLFKKNALPKQKMLLVKHTCSSEIDHMCVSFTFLEEKVH